MTSGKLSDPQVGMKLILRGNASGKHKKDFVQVRLADLQVAVAGTARVDADQIAFFQPPDVGGKGSGGQSHGFSQIVHTHSAALEKEIQNSDPDF